MRITEHEIEFSPLSIKGKKALQLLKDDINNNGSNVDIQELENEDSFIKKFYVRPFTRFESENMEEDNLFGDDLIDNEYEILKNKQSSFEENILSNNARLLWIYGTAGCGKTTYIHSFYHQNKDKIFIDFCDLEDAKRRITISISNVNYNIENSALEDNNCYRFSIRLINKILYFLKIETNNFDVANIVHIRDLYLNRFKDKDSDAKEVISFFNILENIEKDGEKCLKDIIAFFQSILNNFSEDCTNNIPRGIIILSDILLHVLLCYGNLIKKRVVCVFDNIEYYISIKHNERDIIITDKTIETILNCLQDSIAGLVNKYLDYEYVPKYIVVTRYATVAFNRNSEMDAHNCCDITTWFNPKEIYDIKIEFILNNIRKDNGDSDLVYKAFRYIMNDCTRSKWSLASLLSKFFNYNYRRLARIVLYTLKINVKHLRRFIDVWESRKQYGLTYKTNITHLCRMFIIERLLSSINAIDPNSFGERKVPYFSRLFSECKFKLTRNIESVPSVADDVWHAAKLIEPICEECDFSYAHCLLSVLHRANIENSYVNESATRVGVKYYSFEKLLSDIFLSDCRGDVNNINEDCIIQLSKVITLMNETTDETGWVPLTSIKSQEKAYDQQSIAKLLQTAKQNLQNHEEDLSSGIRITYAGQVLLMLMPEFEYFSVRHGISNSSLLVDNFVLDNRIYSNIKSIKSVLYNLVAYSYAIIQRDLHNNTAPGGSSSSNSIDYNRLHKSKVIYKENQNSRLWMYPQRLFIQQINYLKTYRMCIERLALSNSELSYDQGAEMLKELDKYIGLFIEWEAYFSEQYEDYFDITNI